MSQVTAPARRRPSPLKLGLLLAALASIGLGVIIVMSNASAIAAVAARGRGLHAPDLALLLAQPPAVLAHVLVALAALALGPVMLLSRKGARFHRRAGWTWATLMAAAAVTSMFLTTRTGSYSYIHIMSGTTLLMLPLALHAARRHDVARHQALMLWLFYLMLVGAALFTLVPGRLMWRLFFG